jgi:dihydropteroate synthase
VAQELVVDVMNKKPIVMGVLNVTPDSFFDGGCWSTHDKAIKHALDMIKQGADIIDIGGESSRPGAQAVSLDEELTRVIPVIERLVQESDIPISIDTYKPQVMAQAMEAGATMINDIKALRSDGALEIAARTKVTVCLMHMRGEPQSMQVSPGYQGDIIESINQFFENRLTDCLTAGILRENIILDPGFGFGKTVSHNLCIMKRLSEFSVHKCRMLVGVSRKSTIGEVLNVEAHDRLIGSLALAVIGFCNGANIIRTHDVRQTVQALKMAWAVSEVN